jgi:hypothetical protein
MINDSTAQPHSARNRNPFMDMHNQAVQTGMLGARTRSALEWYRNTMRSYKNPYSVNQIKNFLGESASRSVLTVGGIYTYSYDAKTKAELPYWDSQPLIVVLRSTGSNGFLGLNLHYAPPKARALILHILYQLLTDTNMNERTRLSVTYRKINRMASFQFFQPLVKQYLNTHVRSKFIKIPPSEWQTMLFLPTARWQKDTSNRVYADYNKRVRGRF